MALHIQSNHKQTNDEIFKIFGNPVKKLFSMRRPEDLYSLDGSLDFPYPRQTINIMFWILNKVDNLASSSL